MDTSSDGKLTPSLRSNDTLHGPGVYTSFLGADLNSVSWVPRSSSGVWDHDVQIERLLCVAAFHIFEGRHHILSQPRLRWEACVLGAEYPQRVSRCRRFQQGVNHCLHSVSPRSAVPSCGQRPPPTCGRAAHACTRTAHSHSLPACTLPSHTGTHTVHTPVTRVCTQPHTPLTCPYMHTHMHTLCT